MIEGNLLYEGKAKTVYETDDPELLLVYFKDDATAGNTARLKTRASSTTKSARFSLSCSRIAASKVISSKWSGNVKCLSANST